LFSSDQIGALTTHQVAGADDNASSNALSTPALDALDVKQGHHDADYTA